MGGLSMDGREYSDETYDIAYVTRISGLKSGKVERTGFDIEMVYLETTNEEAARAFISDITDKNIATDPSGTGIIAIGDEFVAYVDTDSIDQAALREAVHERHGDASVESARRTASSLAYLIEQVANEYGRPEEAQRLKVEIAENLGLTHLAKQIERSGAREVEISPGIDEK